MTIFPEWFYEAEALYIKGDSYTQIGKILSVDRKKVSKYLREAGYKSNLKYHPGLSSTSYRKYYLNDASFEVIDTEEKAYWLGFLYADGAINSSNNVIELSLQESDESHLYKFKDFLAYTGKVSIKIKKTPKKDYISYRVLFSSEQMKKNLIRLGCTPRKSKTLTFPSHELVPEELIRHFIRGYVDGDGCIGKTSGGKISLEVLGTEVFLSGYIKYIKNLGVQKLNLNSFSHSDIKRAMHSSNDARMILNDLYKNATVYLERKYEKYKEFAV